MPYAETVALQLGMHGVNGSCADCYAGPCYSGMKVRICTLRPAGVLS